jgi:hypothetical protein
MNGDYTPLGNEWISQFLSRQPRVISIVGRSIEAPRAQAGDPDVIRALFELFERTWVELGIQYEDI